MESKDRFCWACGSSIWGNDRFCRKCGDDLNRRVPVGQERGAEPEVTSKAEPEVTSKAEPEATSKAEPEATQPQVPADTQNGSKEDLYLLGVIVGWSIAAFGTFMAIRILLQDLNSGLSSFWLLSNLTVWVLIAGGGILIARRCGKARHRLQRISHTDVSAPVTTHRSFREYISKALPVINDYLDPFLRPIEHILSRWKWVGYSLLVLAVILPAAALVSPSLVSPSPDPRNPVNMNLSDRATWYALRDDFRDELSKLHLVWPSVPLPLKYTRLKNSIPPEILEIECTEPKGDGIPCEKIQKARDANIRLMLVRASAAQQAVTAFNERLLLKDVINDAMGFGVKLLIIYGVGFGVVLGTRKLRKYRGGINEGASEPGDVVPP